MWNLAFATTDYQVPVKVMESFEEGIPGYVQSTGELRLDERRMKHGTQALGWDWSGNDWLSFNTPIGYRKQRSREVEAASETTVHSTAGLEILEPPRGFFMWVHNDTPAQQRMRIQFGRGDVVDCEFDFNLDFRGWRTVALIYDRGDMRGVPREDMDRMTIHAPATGSGTFTIDMVGLSVPMNPRTMSAPNPQLPAIDPHPRLVSQYEQRLYEASLRTPHFNLKPVDDVVLADFRRLDAQAEAEYLDFTQIGNWADSRLADVFKAYDDFGIVRDGEEIYGAPLSMSTILREQFSEVDAPTKESFKTIKRWRHDYGQVLLRLARAWHYVESPEAKAEIETRFVDLFDYGVDQGFAAGAGLGWIHHYSYVIREHAPAMFLMRDVLARHDRLEEAIALCKWMYAFNQVYSEDVVYGVPGRVAEDADALQGLLVPRLTCALMMPDSPEKARDVRHYSSYLSNVSSGYANALDECFKPDGTFFHHAGHAYGYGGRAILGVATAMKILEGTAYEASKEAYRRTLKVADTYFLGLFGPGRAAPKAFASIRFKRYVSAHSHRRIHAKLGAEHEPFDGFRMLSYSSVGVRRQADDWMVTARGHSKYVYPWESWGPGFFAYPLFLANGYLDVSYPDSLDSLSPIDGVWHAGLDWRRWPGATVVRLPYEAMITRVGQVRDEGGEYLFSDQAFAGGVETSYGCGVQVFAFKGHDKYGLESFSGKKSYFFVGNKVVALGTDIESGIADYPVETVLFQDHLSSKEQAIVVNGQVLAAFPFVKHFSDGKEVWFVDTRGTGFFVPGGGVHFTRGEQTNPDSHGKKPLSGNFASAWIDHGKTPGDASYEYVLVADTDAEEMAAFAEAPTVRVLQKDSDAHVVELSEEHAVAYAVYASEGTRFGSGPIHAVNRAATFVAKKEGAGLRLSVADPDLNIYDGQDDRMPDGTRVELSLYEREWFFWPSRPTKVQLVVAGHWCIQKLETPMETAANQPLVISAEGGKTVVEFECRDGLSAEVLLLPEN